MKEHDLNSCSSLKNPYKKERNKSLKSVWTQSLLIGVAGKAVNPSPNTSRTSIRRTNAL
jgi:hypothetical protein